MRCAILFLFLRFQVKLALISDNSFDCYYYYRWPSFIEEGQQQGGGADAGAEADYGDDVSEEYNSPAAPVGRGGNGGRGQGGGSQYERQIGGASHFAPGRKHAVFDSVSPTFQFWSIRLN